MRSRLVDLSCFQVIRHYHGHLSGVYSMALHPSLDVLMTGGRDSVRALFSLYRSPSMLDYCPLFLEIKVC